MRILVWVVALIMFLLLLPFLIVSYEHQETSDEVTRSDDAILPIPSYDNDFINLVDDKLFLNSGLRVGQYSQMQVVYTWIPSYCRVHKGTVEKCQTNFEKKENFSVHGLWPADNNGDTLQPNPTRPCREPLDIFYVLQKLQGKLQAAMPALGDIWSDMNFWRSQWLKHGCLQNVVKVEPYFEAAYEQWFKTNLLRFLEKDGITPSDTASYTRAKIETAIMNGIGGDGQTKILISCKSVPVGDGKYDMLLYEIYVCLNRRANKKEACANKSGDTKGCGVSGNNIKLPHKFKKVLEI